MQKRYPDIEVDRWRDSTLFAAFAYPGPRLERVIRWFMIGNGLLIPFLALQTFYRPLIWVASAWAITLPGSAVALALDFRRQMGG